MLSKWIFEFFKNEMSRSKIAKVYPISFWQPLIKNHSIKFTILPKPVFTVIRKLEIWSGRLLLWKLWRYQYYQNQKSIWLHWKRRCSATCWRFKNPILIDIDRARALWTWKKGFYQICQNNFWCLIFDDLSWTQFWR